MTPTTTASDTGSTSTTPAAQTAPSSPTVAPQSWLAPAQVPFNSAEHWTGGTDSTARSGATRLLESEPIVYPCMDHGYKTLTQDVSGYKVNVFTGSGAAEFGPSPEATQYYITYSSSTAAQSVLQAIKQDLTGCTAEGVGSFALNTNRPATTTETDTASTADSIAYTYLLRDDKGQPAEMEGNYSNAADYHTYIAVNGATIEILWLAGGSDIDGSSNDAAILQTLAGTLN